MKKTIRFLILLTFTVTSGWASAQSDSLHTDSLYNYELQLMGLSYNAMNGADQQTRTTSTFYFIQTLKAALKVKGSFNYPFDSLKTISIKKSQDNKFRIFTWNLIMDNRDYKYFGALQMNNPDSLEMYGLYDRSDSAENPLFSTYDNRHWMGALYYKMHEYKHKKKKYYLLFGWDGDTRRSNKKLVDVLWFDQDNKPIFGAPVFRMEKDSALQYRLMFEFDDKATMVLRHEKEKNFIVFDHLVPPSPAAAGIYQLYLPDGTYDYLKYRRGIWVKQEMLFDKVKIKSGN